MARGRADAGQHPEQPQPRQFITRILQDTEVAEDILHVGLLEESQAAADLERDVAALEFKLDLETVPVAAIEDRQLKQATAFIEQVQDILGDEAGLDGRVEGWRGKSVSSPRLIKRSMRFSRTTLACTFLIKGYVTYRAGSAFDVEDSGLRT